MAITAHYEVKMISALLMLHLIIMTDNVYQELEQGNGAPSSMIVASAPKIKTIKAEKHKVLIILPKEIKHGKE